MQLLSTPYISLSDQSYTEMDADQERVSLGRADINVSVIKGDLASGEVKCDFFLCMLPINSSLTSDAMSLGSFYT